MRIRTRILVGYSYLVGLLVLGAASAAIGFSQLGAAIDRVLAENVDSVRACIAMLESLERQDSATLRLLIEGLTRSDALEAADRTFNEALAQAADNVTIDGEVEAVTVIRSTAQRYREARTALLAADHERPLAAYESETFPRFNEVKTAVFALTEMNRKAIEGADREARRTARRRAILHGALVTIALLSLAVLSRELGRAVLGRLAELESTARHLAAGDLDRRLPTGIDDELGQVATVLNHLLDRQQQVTAASRGLVQQQRQLLLAVVAALPEPAAVLSRSGSLVASTLGDDLDTQLGAAAGLLSAAEEQAATTGGPVQIECGGAEFSLTPLVAPTDRRVGWLARPAGAASDLPGIAHRGLGTV